MAERVFVLPDLGEGLEDGRIVGWLVAEGDEVTLNQPLVEVETAKATVEIPSPFAGRIVRLHALEGVDVPVGAALVTFELEGGVPDAAAPEVAEVQAYSPFIEQSPSHGRIAATPPVRKLAKDLRVDIETVRGTGPDGRVTDDDVRRAAARIESWPEGALAVTLREDLGVGRIEVDHVRREVAANLSNVAAIPQVTTFRAVDCSALQAARDELDVSPLPIVLAALCTTIDAHPILNARWADDHIELRTKINVGIAADTERGLVVPVLQDAGRRGIGDLATEIGRLAGAARAGKLALEDIVATATIGVSNTGSYGSEAGTPLLTPGCAVTLAFGVIQPRALVVDGAVVARPAATLSLTFDHRVLDGAAAGRALTDLVDRLQSTDLLRNLPR
jgi:pyruvate dehydrogenase E2 component (dihydrolipoamide acetyltransferase)